MRIFAVLLSFVVAILMGHENEGNEEMALVKHAGCNRPFAVVDYFFLLGLRNHYTRHGRQVLSENHF